jgi:hypothetical protein
VRKEGEKDDREREIERERKEEREREREKCISLRSLLKPPASIPL